MTMDIFSYVFEVETDDLRKSDFVFIAGSIEARVCFCSVSGDGVLHMGINDTSLFARICREFLQIYDETYIFHEGKVLTRHRIC